tara:strand:+ start:2708 stop:3076 length:369 start_codon:yes stop_codon:yes gene_type:complete
MSFKKNLKPGEFSISCTVFTFEHLPQNAGSNRPTRKDVWEVDASQIEDIKNALDTLPREKPFYEGENSPALVVKLELPLWDKVSTNGNPYHSGYLEKPYVRPATPKQANQVSSARTGGGLGI